MQHWVDKHPILFVLSDGLFIYFAVSLVASWWSGWAVLARQFRLRGDFNGSQWRFQNGVMRWLSGYNNCLTVGANPQGLYLRTLPFFPLFHPPLFIPWTEVSFEKRKFFFRKGVRFHLRREDRVTLWLQQGLSEKIKEAAGPGYPIETLGA